MSKAFLSATKFEVGINKAALLKSITAGSNGKITGRQVRNYILPVMEEAQRKLIKDFHNHSITKEINSGVSGSNSSGTLGGYGNLFSFIGFENGDNPMVAVDNLLKEKLVVRVRSVGNGRFKISILNAPSKEEIYRLTPLPWADGASWAEGMEKGISNLGSFLYTKKPSANSRSGRGLQLNKQLRGSSFRTTPYVSKIMDEFLKGIINF